MLPHPELCLIVTELHRKELIARAANNVLVGSLGRRETTAMLPQNETSVEVTRESAFFDRLTRRFAMVVSRRDIGATALGALTGLCSLDPVGAAPCPKGKKRCRKRCVPKKHCCKNANCRPGVTGRMCRKGRCVCPPARSRTCQGRCVARTDCCPACPAGQECRAGGCCYATSAALQAALEPGGPAVIQLCPNTTYPGTYTIGHDVTMIGAGAASTILDGAAAGTVVTVLSDVTAQLQGVRITNGTATGTGTGGGGIYLHPRAALTLEACEVTRNRAASAIGGGIRNLGTLTLVATNVTANEASLNGGGIVNVGLLTLRNGSSVAGNSALAGGGISNNQGTVIIEDTTSVTNNTARSEGGGIDNAGFNFESGNVYLSGASRVARNSALEGGGIRHLPPGEVRFSGSSCVGPNPVGGNCSGTDCVICP